MGLSARAGISSGAIAKTMEILNEVYEGFYEEIPCRNTVDLWVRKLGLGLLEEAPASFSDKEYCMILDECMMIGSNKLLLGLAAPATHPGRPLGHSDVAIVSIDVASSINSEKVRQTVSKVSGNAGHGAEYAITDNASIMKKGSSLANLPHHLDISHSLAMFLERAYKNEEDFKAFHKAISQAQFQNNMKEVAYIMPPKQRTVARFMNMGPWAEWSQKTLQLYSRLPKPEREALSFLPANASLIDELSTVMDCIAALESIFKQKGCSRRSIAEGRSLVGRTLMLGNHRMRSLGCSIMSYLAEESKLLQGEEVHNISSDILESTYGILKERKSPNKLYGVTSLVLTLPAHGRICDPGSLRDIDLGHYLQKKRVKDIGIWVKENLPENLVSKRIRTLKCA